MNCIQCCKKKFLETFSRNFLEIFLLKKKISRNFPTLIIFELNIFIQNKPTINTNHFHIKLVVERGKTFQ